MFDPTTSSQAGVAGRRDRRSKEAQSKAQVDLSLVVPAYNEEELIGGSLRTIHDYLSGLSASFEILLVDDGSTDRTVERALALDLSRLRILRRPHLGKGAALSAGFLASRGTYAAFLDADLEIQPHYLADLLQAVEGGYGAAIASKVAGTAHRSRTPLRRLATWGYNALARALFRSPSSDHQAGLKLFRGDLIRGVVVDVHATSWIWDTEVLVELQRLGTGILEVPITITRTRRASKVSLFATSFEMLAGLLALRVRKWRQWRDRSAHPGRRSGDVIA